MENDALCTGKKQMLALWCRLNKNETVLGFYKGFLKLFLKILTFNSKVQSEYQEKLSPAATVFFQQMALLFLRSRKQLTLITFLKQIQMCVT